MKKVVKYLYIVLVLTMLLSLASPCDTNVNNEQQITDTMTDGVAEHIEENTENNNGGDYINEYQEEFTNLWE